MRGGLSDIKEQHHLYFVAVTLTVIVVLFPLLSGIKVLHAQNGQGYFNVVLQSVTEADHYQAYTHSLSEI